MGGTKDGTRPIVKSGEHFTTIRTVDGDDVKAIVCNVEENSCKLPLDPIGIAREL